ncbi:hypothetical protein BH23CHL5_BH23CHL5_25010 [soil metagenome]
MSRVARRLSRFAIVGRFIRNEHRWWHIQRLRKIRRHPPTRMSEDPRELRRTHSHNEIAALDAIQGGSLFFQWHTIHVENVVFD